MNRKSFLNLTARAGIFLGFTPSLIGCKTQDMLHEDHVNELLLDNKDYAARKATQMALC